MRDMDLLELIEARRPREVGPWSYLFKPRVSNSLMKAFGFWKPKGKRRVVSSGRKSA